MQHSFTCTPPPSTILHSSSADQTPTLLPPCYLRDTFASSTFCFLIVDFETNDLFSFFKWPSFLGSFLFCFVFLQWPSFLGSFLLFLFFALKRFKCSRFSPHSSCCLKCPSTSEPNHLASSCEAYLSLLTTRRWWS